MLLIAVLLGMLAMFGPAAGAASSVTVQNAMMAGSVDATNTCAVPTPVTTFLTANSQALVWFAVSGASTGDSPSAAWYSPDGSLYLTTTWDPVSAPGNGCYWGAIDIAGQGAATLPGIWTVKVLWNGSQLLSLPFTISAQGPPQIDTGGVVNAASFALAPAPVAAGSIVAIFGTGLASQTLSATALPLPTNMNGTQVLVNGIAVPLFAVSPGQINAQIPWEDDGVTQIYVQVAFNGLPSAIVLVRRGDLAPGCFSINQAGTGQGAIMIATTEFLAAPVGSVPGRLSRPAEPGEYLSLYCTGLGAVTNPPASGAAASSSPLSWTRITPAVTIGSVPAPPVSFSGLAPGFVGLNQINVQIPNDAPRGDAVPVSVTAGSAISNAVTVAIAGPGPFALTVAKAGAGSGTVTSFPQGINCGAACRAAYASGIQVTLTATADPGSSFAGWSGAGCSGTGACTVMMSANQSVTATFNVNSGPQFTLTVAKSGTGSGTVTSSPQGINCGATCSASYASGTQVTLSAAADPGSSFAGWSGAGCSGAGACTVTMSGNQIVTAAFNLNSGGQFTLTVAKSGTGSGTVTSSPQGINCGATCSASYASGAQVTLSATADPGSSFAGWSGAGCSGSGACTVTMSANQSVTATFNLNSGGQFTLTVAKIGTGSGTVTSSPQGINCGATCSANYASGTQVALTAAADPGSSFAGWSGAGCSGSGACTVTMSANQSVTATFNLSSGGQFTLTVAEIGTGGGTVTSSPAGIVCGATCSASYASGTQVTLTATAASGSVFDGWLGAYPGTGPAVVTMDAYQTVVASFSPQGSGGGTPSTALHAPQPQPTGACVDTYTGQSVVYALTLVAWGGSPFSGYTWTPANASPIPAGTIVQPLSGIFMSNGGPLSRNEPSQFDMVINDGSHTATATFPFTVEEESSAPVDGIPGVGCACPAPPFQQAGQSPIPLPAAKLGEDYGAGLYASLGCSGPGIDLGLPLSWSVDGTVSPPGGVAGLPPGLVIDAARGVVRGMPSASAAGQTYVFQIKVTRRQGREVAACPYGCPVYQISVGN